MLGWLPCPRVRYRMVDHQQPPPHTQHPWSQPPAIRYPQHPWNHPAHTTNFPIGKSCALHTKRPLRVSLGQPCEWVDVNTLECAIRVFQWIHHCIWYMLYTFTKKRNYIGRLHFDTFGCLTPHTTDRACFFFIFFDWRSSQKGATGRAYRSSDQASFQNWNYRKPKVWPLHKQKHRGVERLNGLIGGS